MKKFLGFQVGCLAVTGVLFGVAVGRAPEAQAEARGSLPGELRPIVAMRRLTEEQYRNSIADIFGPDVVPTGRFEPIVRSGEQLIASGASSATISPAGLEQFDVLARGVAAQVFDDRRRKVFVRCAPKSEAQADNGCAEKTLRDIGLYVLRRPMTRVETAAYVQMASTATAKSGHFYQGLELALSAMLSSPEFLFITESAEPDPKNRSELRLDNYSRAARLSYLLWNTTPDLALLNAAARGELTDPAKLRQVAERMAASPRLADGVRAFFGDMLKFEKFDQIAKDPVVYPRFNAEVAQSLPEQMSRTIVDHLVTRRGDYRELFTTPHTFMNRALGPLYYVPVRERQVWQPYTFAPNDDRAGLLGQAGFLALYSHSGRSSPTLRGRAIRELLLCQPVPNPPGNVNFTVVQDSNNPALKTARARLDAHATSPACSGCHKITDPIGLPLERFDGIGAFRETENGASLDVSGQLGSARFSGATGLGQALSGDPALTECVAGRTLEYATGRSIEGQDHILQTVQSVFERSGFRFPALMLAVAASPEAYRAPAKPVAPAPAVAIVAPRRLLR